MHYVMNKLAMECRVIHRIIVMMVIMILHSSLFTLHSFGQEKISLSLDECITMARRQSVDAAVALGELKSAYWQWRSYKADLLPEVTFSVDGNYNKRYNNYQNSDGSMSYVRNDYLGMNGSLYVTHKIWPTGGTLSVESSLDYINQSGISSPQGQFMSLPVALRLYQPLFGINRLKWDRKIEPLNYR